jgi:hypothetical protein
VPRPVSNYVRGRESTTRPTLRQSRLSHFSNNVVADHKNAEGAPPSIFRVGPGVFSLNVFVILRALI